MGIIQPLHNNLLLKPLFWPRKWLFAVNTWSWPVSLSEWLLFLCLAVGQPREIFGQVSVGNPWHPSSAKTFCFEAQDISSCEGSEAIWMAQLESSCCVFVGEGCGIFKEEGWCCWKASSSLAACPGACQQILWQQPASPAQQMDRPALWWAVQ